MSLFETDKVLVLKNVRPRLSNAGTNGKPLFYLIELPSNGIRITDEINIKHLVVATNCLKDSFCLNRCKELLQSWSTNPDNLKEHMNNQRRNDIVPTTHLFSELVPNEQRLVREFSNFQFANDNQRIRYCQESIADFIQNVLTHKEVKITAFGKGVDLVALHKKLAKLTFLPYPNPTAWGDYTEAFLRFHEFISELSNVVYLFCQHMDRDQAQLRNYTTPDPLCHGWVVIDNYQKRVTGNMRWEDSGPILKDPATLSGNAKRDAENNILDVLKLVQYGVNPLVEYIRSLDKGVKELYDEDRIDIEIMGGEELGPGYMAARAHALESIHGIFSTWIKRLLTDVACKKY